MNVHDIRDSRNVYSMWDTFMLIIYNNGKYQCQYGPFSLEEALRSAHVYDGLKHKQAVVWDSGTGEDVYKSKSDID